MRAETSENLIPPHMTDVSVTCGYQETLLTVTKPHLRAKLYSASFLSWRDKCLSHGDFPKDSAAG